MNVTPDRLILFDPLCNLCSSVVNYILRRDKDGIFRFGSLYSSEGKHIKKRLPWKIQQNTLLYFEDEQAYMQSEAVIRILEQLPRHQITTAVLRVIPSPLRNGGYRLIARFRYRIAGKRKIPFQPDSIYKNRFIEFSGLPDT